MKTLILLAAVLLTACAKGGGSSETAKAAPKAPEGPVAPAAPAVTYQWPATDAAQTSSFNSYSCSVTTGKGVGCFDGTNAPYYQPAPYTNEVASVVVGSGIVCAMLDSNGSPNTCTTSISDPGCTNPPNDALVVCWTPASQNPVAMWTATQAGLGDQTLYNYGPSALTVDSNGVICITESIYDVNSTPYGNWIQDVQKCGTTIQTGGFLQ